MNTTATNHSQDAETILVPKSFLQGIAKEALFFADIVGMTNNAFDDIGRESRSDLLITAVERIHQIKNKIQKLLENAEDQA